ncbi:hypothetical protein AWN76_017230 [Rhodothermaceae bacterium RA]|nr:hypothetical protein AWN76_017230 [Rhodothermaceae bacterium RA]
MRTISRTVAGLRLPGVLCALLLLASPLSPLAQPFPIDRLAGMSARSIGPAGMSGRVTSIDVVRSNPDVIYVGTASGGLWMSENGGIDWTPLFDEQPVASIGAVAIAPSNPDVIYVGTGEGNPRNSQSSGNGVYKSLDGGRTWQHLGLEESRNIHRVLIHPTDPNVVYVGAQGPAWGETPERGVFKTTDGGKTWRKVLYVNERTGIADLVMDPQNPDKLIAAMWEFRRWPWFFESGGEGSGLYVTHDGGETWTQRTHEDGLPRGELGRIGLAIAPSNPDVVYAVVEAAKNGFYRSTDGGATWTRTRGEGNFGNRPFYYFDIYVDPQNEHRIYSLHSIVTVSIDGGDTWETLIPYADIHPDHHAWYIHPDDPSFIIDGNDGGLAISRDRGATWRFVENLPLAQFYHINVDMAVPYHVYGGMQDNGSWKGPAYVWRSGGIRNAYWEEVAFGDGFDVVVDPTDPRYVYAMSQGGYLYRSDTETGERKLIRPIHPDGEPLRFNWNAGIALDPFDPQTVYYGSQYVHKSTDRGDSWTIISPDLTTNDTTKQRQLESGGLTYDVTQAENFTTILTIAPSPLERGVLWVGTDDGQVQLTRDGGQTWTNVVGRIPGVPEGTWVPQIRASKHRPGEAFVVFDDHRRNNWTPYVYRTRDYGRTWTRIVAPDKGVWGYALAIEQDPVAENLLFLGTEFGLYVSIDGGAHWTKWTHGVPTVSVMDLVIHPREHDLVIGTFGRSAYVLDDIRPLRALALDGVEVLDRPLHVFEAPDAYLAEYAQATGTRFAGDALFAGENRDAGARITYVLNPPAEEAENEAEHPAGAAPMEMDGEAIGGSPAPARDDKDRPTVRVEVLDAAGTVIRTLEREAKPGLQRFTWNLDARGERFPSQPKPRRGTFDEPGGMPILPGTYTVRLTYGEHVAETQVTVHPDPRTDVAEADLQAQLALLNRLNLSIRAATAAMDRLREAKQTIASINEWIEDRDDEAADSLRALGRTTDEAIEALMERFRGQEVQGIRRDPETVNALLSNARSYLTSFRGRPGETHRLTVGRAETAVREAIEAVNTFFGEKWPRYQHVVEIANVSFFESYEPLRIHEE